MKFDRGLGLLISLLIGSASTASAQAVLVHEPVRPFGYSVGDILQQRLYLTPAPGQTVIAESMPKEGRANLWLQRRSVSAVPENGRLRIDIAYQFINSPKELLAVELPSVRIQLKEGDHVIDAASTPLSLTLAPLTVGSSSSLDLRPDTPPPQIDLGPRLRRLAIYAALAIAIGLFLAAWHFGFGLHGRRQRPFAVAEREIRRLLKHDGAADGRRNAMRRLHQAFNSAANETVFSDALDRFFSRHTIFEQERELVRAFFTASRSEFFGGDERINFDSGQIIALVRRLKLLERDAP